MAQTKHTQGTLTYGGSFGGSPTAIMAGTMQVAHVLVAAKLYDAPGISPDEADANAERFVRTWNSHAELVGVCQHLDKMARDILIPTNFISLEAARGYIEEMLEYCNSQAAIANAEK